MKAFFSYALLCILALFLNPENEVGKMLFCTGQNISPVHLFNKYIGKQIPHCQPPKMCRGAYTWDDKSQNQIYRNE